MDSKAFIGNSSIHKVRVANSRESQLLKTRLKTLDSQKRFTMTQTNFLIRKTCIKLDKMRSMLKDPGNGKKQTDKKPDEIKGKNDKKITNIEGLLRDETILIPSLKRLISFAMEKSMDIKDEGNDSDKKLEDNFKQDNSTHEPNTNQELDCCEVAPKAVEDEKDQISDNLQPLIELRELTTLVESMYGSEEGEFSSDKIVKCLLPILSGTNLNTEDTADESNKMLLLNKILSKEFPEVYREHEQGMIADLASSP